MHSSIALEDSAIVGPLQAGLLKQRRRLPSEGNCYPLGLSGDAAGRHARVTPSWQRIQQGARPQGVVSHGGSYSNQQPQSLCGDGSLGWKAICEEARTEADRKRGIRVAADDSPELKQWLISDVIGQLLTPTAPGRLPPSRSSALTPRRYGSPQAGNWPGAGVYEASASAAAEARMFMTPPRAGTAQGSWAGR